MEQLQFGNYIKLHESGKNIREMSPLKNPTYRVLVKSNIDIRVIDRDSVYSLVTGSRTNDGYIRGCEKLSFFLLDKKNVSHRYFYSIPIQTPSGEYVGFIYRTLFDKAYASVFRPFSDKNKKVPYMFGFFKDFQQFNRHTKCMPIVVCEGAKDAIMLKQFYPYTLSNNTSSLGMSSHVLANITDKILLAYDNDDTGRECIASDRKYLTRLGCSVDVLKYHDGFKDMADYIDHPQELREIRSQLKNKLNGLIYGTVMSV